MNWDLFFKGAPFVLSIIVGIYAFFSNRRKDIDQQFGAVDRRQAALEDRMKDVEAAVLNAPGKDDLHAISVVMAEMRGEFRVLATEIKGLRDLTKRMENVVGRHEDHLLSGSNK